MKACHSSVPAGPSVSSSWPKIRCGSLYGRATRAQPSHRGLDVLDCVVVQGARHAPVQQEADSVEVEEDQARRVVGGRGLRSEEVGVERGGTREVVGLLGCLDEVHAAILLPRVLRARAPYGLWVTDAPADLRLRPATALDVDFLTDVVVVATQAQGRWPADADEVEFRAGFAEWTAEQVRGDEPDSTLSVIEVGGLPVGRHRVVRTPDGIELAGLQLLPTVQGRGIGTWLVLALVEEAEEAGLPALISVERDNPRARALYERLGFRGVGQDERDDHLRRP